MNNVYSSLGELIGRTPILKMNKLKAHCKLDAEIFGKLEFFNPAGSIKDRVALQMIEDMEKDGRLKEGSTIIEPTSGNTGIGLAAIGKSKGYKVILSMPESMSIERRKLLSAYGAEIVLTEAKEGMLGAINKANELKEQIEGSVIMGQFENPSNPLAHYTSTAVEIYEDMDKKVDILVAGVGTGGTISGIGRYLKEKNPQIKIVAVEPSSSPLITKGVSGSHGLMGIGANFIPENLDLSIVDETIAVGDEDAYEMGRLTAQTEGVLIGISAAAALYAATLIAKRIENKGKNIVVILPDGGDRYLSTPMFE